MEPEDLLNYAPSQAREVDNENLVDCLEVLPQRYNYIFSIQPMETDLKKLLREASGQDDIENINDVKLQIISKSAGLHRLADYTPRLETLVLDESCVRSLRDLGSSLKLLSTLSVVRCYLNSLDGIWGFPSLKNLIARDNLINDPSPCSAVPKLAKLDLTNNDIDDVELFLFLQNCRHLRELSILRNNFQAYTEYIKNALPQVRLLDGVALDNCTEPTTEVLSDESDSSSGGEDVVAKCIENMRNV